VKADGIRRGDELFRAQEYKQAVAAYQSAVKADPKDGELRRKLAEAHRGAQQWQDLARQSIVAADLLPEDLPALSKAIEGFLILGRFDDAIDRVAPLLIRRADDVEVQLMWAHAKARIRNDTFAMEVIADQLAKGQDLEGARLKVRVQPTQDEDADAEKSYRRAYELAGEKGPAVSALAGFLWTTGRSEEGAAILKKAPEAEPRAFLARSLGLYSLQAKQDAQAEQYLKQASSLNDRPARLALADFYVRSSRINEALALVETIPGDDPDVGANLRAAEISVQAGKRKEALDRAEKVLAKQPKNARALQVKARVLLADGDVVEALNLARQSVALDGVSREARMTLAEALATTGRLVEAFDQYSDAWRGNTRDPVAAKALAKVALALGRHGIAVDLANQSLRLKPGDPEAAVILARGTLRLGKTEAAEKALAPFMATKATSAEILALEGEIQAAKGRSDLARAAFIKALQLKPDLVEALDGLVTAEIKTGDVRGAKVQVEQALSKRPKDPSLLLLVAKVALAEKNMARAESALRQILDLDAASEPAVVLYATVLKAQGRHKEAQTFLEKAIAGQPTSLLRFTLAAAFEDQGQFPEAQAQYEQVMNDNQLSGANAEMFDDYNEASGRLAALFADQGRSLDQALQLVSSAKRYRPNDPALSDTLGWVHVRKDRARIGIPFLEAAVKAEPANRLFLYHLAAAHEQLGDIERARAELGKALEGNPKFRGIDGARDLQKSIGR
jgi:tetratricopeptide (TPR) repeat protein